jgi:hypothetical protein
MILSNFVKVMQESFNSYPTTQFNLNRGLLSILISYEYILRPRVFFYSLLLEVA